MKMRRPLAVNALRSARGVCRFICRWIGDQLQNGRLLRRNATSVISQMERGYLRTSAVHLHVERCSFSSGTSSTFMFAQCISTQQAHHLREGRVHLQMSRAHLQTGWHSLPCRPGCISNVHGIHLQPVPLNPSIKRAPAQSQRLRGAADVAAEAAEGFADEEHLHFFDAHVFDARGAIGGAR